MKKTVEKELSAKERQRIYNKQYYAEHREAERKRVEEYKKQHKDELRQKNKEYREKNRDRIKAYRDTERMKQYQKEYQKAYRAQKKAQAEMLAQEQGEEIMSGEKIIISDLLSIWIGIKSLIDIQAQSQDISQQNFEDFLFENGELQILNEISNSYFLWQRAHSYFAHKQREKLKDYFCKEMLENDERKDCNDYDE